MHRGSWAIAVGMSEVGEGRLTQQLARPYAAGGTGGHFQRHVSAMQHSTECFHSTAGLCVQLTEQDDSQRKPK